MAPALTSLEWADIPVILEERHVTTIERVRKVVAEQLDRNPDEVTPEASFEDLGADSLDMVELTMAFEEEFDIEIPDEDAEKIRTVQDAVNYLSEKTKA